MKTLIFILMIVSFIACNKYHNDIVDTKIVYYLIETHHELNSSADTLYQHGFDFSFKDKNGITQTRTSYKDHWDTTFVNNTNDSLYIYAKAHTIQSYLAVGIKYNNRIPVLNDIDNHNSDYVIDSLTVSCKLIVSKAMEEYRKEFGD